MGKNQRTIKQQNVLKSVENDNNLEKHDNICRKCIQAAKTAAYAHSRKGVRLKYSNVDGVE